ncbi:MAG: phosphoglycerate kinase, partial [Pseudomonadota bacterium]
TFLFANGFAVGQSLCEKDMADEAKNVMALAEQNNCTIILPDDQIGVREFKENADHEIVARGKMGDDQESIDVGPETITNIQNILQDAKTVLWNGPMGVFEMKPFDKGTNEVAQKVAELTKAGQVISVAGGGDTVAALENAGVAKDFTYISTAGGAFLEWLEGKTLPSVAALMTQAKAA